MKRQILYMRLLLAAVAAFIIAACASMGRPEGGPIDETPPVYVRSNPAPGSTNVTADRYTITFDENVQIKDAINKVVVSPPQKTVPKISAVGKNVRIEMMDSLLPNTTYTIDFTDAISDLNESNELDGFAFDFSTGPTIDSLCISGMVFEAETLEPAQGMLVGVHSNLSDTAIATLPFDRITKTNQLGQFTLRNLKPGTYRVFALNDVNRDNKWDRTEDVAFYDVTVSPSSEQVMVGDTLRSSEGKDSIVMRQATRFLPDDILLTWFNERYKSQYLVKYERPARNRINFEMGAPAETFPTLRFIGGPRDGELIGRYSVLDASPTRDTLSYWLTDTALMNADSLRIEATYFRTDTLGQLSLTTDTLQFNMRKQKAKKKKEEKKDDSDTTAQAPKINLLKLKSNATGSLDVYAPITLESDQPVKYLSDSAIRLEMMVDTVWTPVDSPQFYRPDSLKPMIYRADVKWEPGAKYRLTIDSLGIVGIYDEWCGSNKFEFTVKSLSEYANMSFDISGLDGRQAVVQLLNNQDKPVYTEKADGQRVDFRHLAPGTYYARLFIDRNGNGKWDTGSLTDSVQPEETYYYSKKISLKKNWDLQQSWDIYELPVDLQKPAEIKKNKPKKKRGERDEFDEEEDDQYYDEFGNPAVDPDDPFGKRKNRRFNTLNGRDTQTTQGAGYRGGLRR